MDFEDSNSSFEGGNGDCSKLSEVSLCRADLELLRKNFKRDATYKNYFQNPVAPQPQPAESNEDDILIGEFNERDESEDVKETVNDILNFLRLKRRQSPHSKDFEKKRCSQDVNLITFVRQNELSDPLLSHLGVQHDKKPIYSTLVFLPLLSDNKLRALYIISGGFAWQALYGLSDSRFLASVPLQIAGSLGAKCHKVHCLVGKFHSKDSVMKGSEENLRDLDLGDVCTQFTAEVSKVETIPHLQKSIQNFLLSDASMNTTAKFRVTQGRMIFYTKISIDEIKTLVGKLEEVYRNAGNMFPIPEDTKLKRLIIRSSKEVETDLNEEFSLALNENMIKAVKKPSFVHEWSLKDFHLCHILDKQYIEGSDYQMLFKSESDPFCFDSNPSFETVVSKILNLYRKKSELTPFSLPNVLFETKISFQGKSKGRTRGSLLKYLKGQVYSQRYKDYFWLLNGQWYLVSAQMILEVQRKFRNILRNHLMPLDNPLGPPALFHPWGNEKEDEYNLKYQVDKDSNLNYYIGDKKTMKSIEYFDIAYHVNIENDDKTYLYHVKEGFNNHTRDACSQLKNSVEILESMRKPHKMSASNAAQIEKLAKTVFDNKIDHCKKVLGIHPQKRNCLVYVLGLQTNNNLTSIKTHEEICRERCTSLVTRKTYRSLNAEKDLSESVSKEDMRQYINKNRDFKNMLVNLYNVQDPLESLILQLIHHKYLESNEEVVGAPRLTVADTILLMQDDNLNDFGMLLPKNLNLNANQTGIFCRHVKLMLQVYSSYFPSFGAKLEIIRCKGFVESQVDDVKEQFKICEILSDGTRKQLIKETRKRKSDVIDNKGKKSPFKGKVSEKQGENFRGYFTNSALNPSTPSQSSRSTSKPSASVSDFLNPDEIQEPGASRTSSLIAVEDQPTQLIDSKDET